MNAIGINGFGRIGKIVFLQLIDANANVVAINVPDFDIGNLDTYLRCDSNHHYPLKWDIEIIDGETFSINGRSIKLLNSRSAKSLNWRKHGVNYVIDATGVYLTQESAQEHNVDYLIMCAPAKDNTPSFMVGGNHEKYNGERVVSNVSCTSNAIIPCLKALNDEFGIEDANFITVHSATASQQCVDTVKFKNRTSRSLFNNIIPHTTGASKAIYAILPELKGKVHGTSVRVPTSNVSMIDLNVRLKKDCDLSTVLKHAGATISSFALIFEALHFMCRNNHHIYTLSPKQLIHKLLLMIINSKSVVIIILLNVLVFSTKKLAWKCKRINSSCLSGTIMNGPMPTRLCCF